MHTNSKLHGILTIVFGSLFTALTTVFVIFEILKLFPENGVVFSLAFVSGMLLTLALFFISMIRWYNARTLVVSLTNSNIYSLGMKTMYLNRATFETTVEGMRKRFKRRNIPQSLIAFTGTTASTTSSRNADIITFNAKVILYLDKYFTEHKSAITHLFCFYEGAFLVYSFGDSRMDVVNFINTVNDELYRIVENNNIHILITPYFGVDEVKPNETIIEAIENAYLARRISERNFEVLNFYRTGLRNEVNQDDAVQIVKALENKEFVVYYQPKFDLIRNRFISSEALIRWNSPTRGLLPPGMFVPQAQAAGLTHELDTYVFERVCEDLAETKKRGRRLLPVSLNFSLYEFYSANFLDVMIETLKKYDVDPRLIQIEILETTSQANPFLSVSIIKRLKDLGMRVLMDDFGIGYSNIGNLSKIPFDAIKIDKSYIDNITTDRRSRQIVQCIVDLGKISGMEVIAEGVDDAMQVGLLRKMGCDTIQGFYYSQAISKAEFDKFLLNNPFEKEGRR